MDINPKPLGGGTYLGIGFRPRRSQDPQGSGEKFRDPDQPDHEQQQGDTECCRGIHEWCIYLRNLKDFGGMDKVYGWFFPTNPPARTTVQVGLYGKERPIAVDAIAIKTKEG